MRVFVLIDLTLDDPENAGARVFSTREAAENSERKAIAENGGSDQYVTIIVECGIE